MNTSYFASFSTIAIPDGAHWEHPEYAAEPDNQRAATCLLELGTTSDFLVATTLKTRYTGTGPIVKRLVGIQISADNPGAKIIGVWAAKNGVITGENQALPTGAAISTTETTLWFGGAMSKWGTTLTESDVNTAGYGVVVQVQLDAEGSTQATPHVNSIVDQLFEESDMSRADATTKYAMSLNRTTIKNAISATEAAAPALDAEGTLTVGPGDTKAFFDVFLESAGNDADWTIQFLVLSLDGTKWTQRESVRVFAADRKSFDIGIDVSGRRKVQAMCTLNAGTGTLTLMGQTGR